MKTEKLEQICMNLQHLNEDVSVPRNIRRGSKEAKEILMNNNESIDVKVASAISVLDDLVNDPNVPIHGRTAIWSIMGQLESLSSIEG